MTQPITPAALAMDVYHEVARLRDATSATRPMPTTQHNIDFARTEGVGEMLEAYILRPVAEYERNRDKNHSAERELAQTMHQIASAQITIRAEIAWVEVDPWTRLHVDLDKHLANAAHAWSLGMMELTQRNLALAQEAAIRLAQHMGLDALEIVQAESARIEANERAKLATVA